MSIIHGTQGNDSLDGGNTGDIIQAFGGDDILNGKGDNDFIYGGAGNDVMDGGGGSDFMVGGGGSDHLMGGRGSDVIYAQAVLNDSGDNEVDVLNGGRGDDVLVGGDGDTFIGGGGQDAAYADMSGTRSGVTIDLKGVATGAVNVGHDTVLDSIHFGHLLYGSGNDNISLGDAKLSVNGGDGDDVLNAGTYGAVLGGGAGDDTLNGGLEGDKLNGGAGNDLINGGDGADVLNGGDGTDVINGDKGDDMIFAGSGHATLSGGIGADTFIFNNEDHPEQQFITITDLTGTDTIDLSGIDADTTMDGDQAFTLVHGPDNHAGEAWLVYDQSSNTTILRLDTDGDGVANYAIDIDGNKTLFDHFVL